MVLIVVLFILVRSLFSLVTRMFRTFSRLLHSSSRRFVSLFLFDQRWLSLWTFLSFCATHWSTLLPNMPLWFNTSPPAFVLWLSVLISSPTHLSVPPSTRAGSAWLGRPSRKGRQMCLKCRLPWQWSSPNAIAGLIQSGRGQWQAVRFLF